MSKEHLKKVNSWQEFTSHLSVLGQKEKGDSFEELVLHFLTLHPTYVTQLETVWHHRKVPQDVRKILNLPNTDEGIDLVAKTHEGHYWAIQCKYHSDENHSLTRKELATFTDLTFGICKGFELALVCTSADRFSHKLSLHGEKISYIAGDTWRELDADFFSRLHHSLAKSPITITPANPRPHQQAALLEAVRHFVEEGNERGKLIMPCGAGKSLTGWWLADRLEAKTVLVAVPSLSLVKQTLEVWARESVATAKTIRWIAVCSDESVARDEREDAAVLVQDLGVKVHTDSVEIAEWLRHSHDGITVVFTTYQSGRAISDAARSAAITFDLGILDEAHKTVGKKGSLFDHLLHDENIDIRRRVFMTATERRYRGDSDNILSMDDHESYGDTFHLLSFKEALECVPPILSDYKIVTVAVTRAEIANLVKANLLVQPDRGEWNNDLEAEMLASLVALRKAMQKFPIRHAVSFHSSISRAKAFQSSQNVFTDNFPEYGQLDTFHVTGSTPTAARKKVLDTFATSGRSLITNARCLTEGVDVPGIDCVLFADPKRSTVDIVQAVGRALRPSAGKQFGYVVIPVVVDDLGTPEATRFDNVLMVLRALATNDERIVEHFRSVSEGRKSSGNSPVEFTVPDGVQIDADEFVKAIELSAWSRLTKLSWQPFEEARAFVRELELKSEGDWRAFSRGELAEKGKRPVDIPSVPARVYKMSGWGGFGDWLGTGTIAPRLRVYRSFLEAREFVRGLKLKNWNEWIAFGKGMLTEVGKLPDDIPAYPNRTYKNKGWKNFGDWLGTGTIAPRFRVYRSFQEARKFARSLNLRNLEEWNAFCRGQMPEKGSLPNDIPAAPSGSYKDDGWQGVGDWLGTGKIADQNKVYRPFNEAREFARSLKLSTQKEWEMFCKGHLPDKGALPEDIPSGVASTYRNQGWISMGDWLGTGKIADQNKVYRPFNEARAFARSLNLKSQKEWRDFCKGEMPEKGTLPQDIPAAPHNTYKNQGWQNLGDWLGTGTIALSLKLYREFEKARIFSRALGLKNVSEWRAFCKGEMAEKGILPDDIPACPNQTYRTNGWTDFGDWLGTGTVAPRLKFHRPFNDAREFARGLGLKNRNEWIAFCRGELTEKGDLPDDIPTTPEKTYRDKGWQGVGDWLGTGVIASHLKKYRSFTDARNFARSLNLKSGSAWRLFCNGEFPELGELPTDIPACPNQTYKDEGWKSMGDWLGSGIIASNLIVYRSFEDARVFARNLKLKGKTQWKLFCKGEFSEKGSLPIDIPANPDQTYRNKGWLGYADWLGNK